jgi:argininosuccinate lyase
MKLWGGRFSGATDETMRRFNDSIAFDVRLYAADVRGSIAWAGALARAGRVSAAERDQLIAGLEQVRTEFDAGAFEVKSSDEDIHTAPSRASCTRAARATTRWRPTCACTCWTQSIL